MRPVQIYQGSRRVISPQEVLYLKGNSNYTFIFLATGKKILVCKTLKMLESCFEHHGFFRTHRSLLVNLDFIKSYDYSYDGGHIILHNGEVIPVSRRKNKLLKETLLSNQNLKLSMGFTYSFPT
jgi:two-component system, LytTR family, response regulator